MIQVNGQAHPLAAEPTTLLALLTQLAFRVDTVVVERNGDIVTREAFADTMVMAGDVLEVVQFMGGG